MYEIYIIFVYYMNFALSMSFIFREEEFEILFISEFVYNKIFCIYILNPGKIAY